MKLIVLAVLSVTTLAACVASQPRFGVDRPLPCSSEWFQQVEQRVGSGDGLGHGPDVGSAEWKSVIEFRLGLRGAEKLPDADTPDWCDRIDSEVNGPAR